MSNAVSGHGASLAYEKDPSGSQGTFTAIAEIISEIPQGFKRSPTEVTPHNDTIDSYVTGVIRRDEISLQVNFLHADATGTHVIDGTTGLRDHFNGQVSAGFRFRGQGGATGIDECITSGEIINFMEHNPVREGQRTADVTIRCSGPMIWDTVVVGTIG